MSALPLSSPRPSRATPPRRHLDVAPAGRPARRARPRVLPAIVTIAGIGAILLAQLLLSIVLADGAYTIAGLQTEQRDLGRVEQSLTENLELLSSTQNLTTQAEHLGMVASGNPVFLDLSTGAVSGSPTAAGGALTGAGNQIGNALLTDTQLVDPASPTTTTGDSLSTGGSATPSPSSPGTIPSPTSR